MFLDILKAFNNGWNEDIIFKLKQYSISKNLLEFLVHFLKIASRGFYWMAKFPIGRCYCRNPPGIHAKSLVVFTLMIYQPASLRILNYLRMTLSILLFYMTLTYMQTSWMISKITNWAFQLKINFNWDLRKQAPTRRLQPKIEDTLPAISFQ